MRWDREDLKHVLHQAPAIYFVLKQSLDADQFRRLIRILSSVATACDTQASAEEHWAALQVRMAGKSRWDAVVARDMGPAKTAEDGKRRRASFHSVENILLRRPYTAYTTARIQYVIDLFNPANELEMPYLGAGEPVLALLLRELEFGILHQRLHENDAFYTIVADFKRILEPEYVCGERSMAAVLLAYEEDRVDATRRPWDFLYPVYMLRKPTPLAPRETGARNAATTNDSIALLWPILTSGAFNDLPLARLLRRVEVLSSDEVVVQVLNGLDPVLRDEHREAARVLGLTAVQELVPGGYSAG